MAEEKKKEYPAFVYNMSNAAKLAEGAVTAHLGAKPIQTGSEWADQLKTITDDILKRKKFTYDLNGDALYQQYKDKFVRQGKLAMGDAIGQASAMTGGYGNSWAQSVGQQAFQNQLQNLNDIIPELYQMAYDKDRQEVQDLYNQQGLLSSLDDKHYQKYQDDLANWLAERDYLRGVADREKSFDYGVQHDEWVDGYGVYRDEIADAQKAEEILYQQGRDKVEDDKWQKTFDAMYGEKGDGLITIVTPGSKYGEIETGEGWDNGSLSYDKVKALQKALGVTADGLYGYASWEAAGGLTAEEAYEKFVGGPKAGKVDIEKDLNSIVGNIGYDEDTKKTDPRVVLGSGALKTKSEINTYLRKALNEGIISTAEYNELKNKYAPRGYTY